MHSNNKLAKQTIFTIALATVLTTHNLYASSLPPVLPPDWKAQHPLHEQVTHKHNVPAGLTPAQIKTAYGFPAALEGAGQTIAIVDSMDDPNIEADLNTFSNQFNLPACTTANGCFTKMFVDNIQPAADAGWAKEISLDVEWAHAIAPQAKILLIETEDDGESLYEGILLAIEQKASVISLSWGGNEFDGETYFDNIFAVSKVPIVAASGDGGDDGIGASYPASSPTVISAGGTQLTLDAKGNYVSETAWSGSGGGVSDYEYEPAFQLTYGIPSAGEARGVPDVSWNAAPSVGYSVYDTYGSKGWSVIGGTSASAPQWAALIAIMKSAKKGNFNNFNASLYSVVKHNNNLMHDITTGTNGSCGYYCTARSGYDYVTGLGTPQAGNLITRFTN